MKFIEVTQKGVTSMINLAHVIQIWPYKGYTRIILSSLQDGTTMTISVSESYDEIKDLLLD